MDVEFRNRQGEIVRDKVWLIDFANPAANEFLAVNQFTVEEGHFNRRADVVVFINGIPLAVLDLKNLADEQATIRKAFDQFQTYKAQIPSLFHPNALLVISDGHEARLGTVTSDWERFMTWRTIAPKISLTNAVHPPRLALRLAPAPPGDGPAADHARHSSDQRGPASRSRPAI